MAEPLVSIVVPTKNSSLFLMSLLQSIKQQKYKNIETVIVDNYSHDKTLTIAAQYTSNIFKKGPERSTQRNFGAKKAKGKYLFFADSDMIFSPEVILECVKKIKSDPMIKSIIIPEESIGEGFWSHCKRLERSFYIGISFMEAARFFEREIFLKVGGYDENLVSGEDWYLSQKLEKVGKIERIKSRIFHNEGKLSYFTAIKKKYYYARYFSRYINLHDNRHLREQVSITKRYMLFFSNPHKLFSNPSLGIGMLFLKTSEFGFGAVGYALSLINRPSKKKLAILD